MKIYLSPSAISGRGIFARTKIHKGVIIEESPVIVVPKIEIANLDQTQLFNYYFAWGEDYKSGAIALGYGSLINHSYQPNAKYIKLLNQNLVHFVALRDINQDEEVLVNYNGHPGDRTPLWFDIKK